MERVKAGLPAPSTSTAATTHPSISTGGRQLQAARAGRLLAAQRIPAQPSRGQQQQQHLSLDVTEDQEVPGVGHFTAYADGRVRVLFADRTILSLDTDRAQARLILPDGSRQEVPASRPLGVEEYVQVSELWLAGIVSEDLSCDYKTEMGGCPAVSLHLLMVSSFVVTRPVTAACVCVCGSSCRPHWSLPPGAPTRRSRGRLRCACRHWWQPSFAAQHAWRRSASGAATQASCLTLLEEAAAAACCWRQALARCSR